MVRRRHLLLGVTLAISLASAAPSVAGQRYPTDCGAYGQTGHVRSLNVDCNLARDTVDKYTEKPLLVDTYYKFNGFSCKGNLYRHDLDVYCYRKKGRHLIHYRGRTQVGHPAT